MLWGLGLGGEPLGLGGAGVLSVEFLTGLRLFRFGFLGFLAFSTVS